MAAPRKYPDELRERAIRLVLGFLLLAAHDPDTGHLVYVGDVGTRFTDAARRHLLAQLTLLEQPEPPFPGQFTRAQLAGTPTRPRTRPLGTAAPGRRDRIPGVHHRPDHR